MLMNILSTVIVVCTICGVVGIPVGLFNLKVFRAVNGTTCSGLNFVKAFIPFYNITFSRKIAYTRHPIFTAMFVLCVLLGALRVVSLVLITRIPELVVISGFGMYLAIAVFALMYIINAVDFCRMLNCGFFALLFCIFMSPVGYYMLSTQVLPYFRSMEDTLSGTFTG